MRKLLASALSFILLVSLFTIPAAAKESEVTLSEQYGRLYIKNVISQQTLQSDEGELTVYTVATGGTLYQEVLLGYCYKIDRWLAVEENGALRYTDTPYTGWDLDILEPGMPLDPFDYTMNAENDPEFIHVFEVVVREKNMTTRFGLKLDPNAVPKTSRYQSTAELTGATVAEMNYNDFTLTVTNPTDNRDSGTVALVLASKMATVHFIDYDLAPKESKEYHVVVSGHVGVGADEKMVVLGKGWGAYLNADIITFTDDADRDAYRATVPCEREESHYGGTMAQQEDGVRLILCYGQPGDDWLKKYTGIARKSEPHQYNDITHNICKP